MGLPEAFVHWMQPMVQLYQGRCEAQGCEPDGALLGPLLPVLKRYETGTEYGQDEGERG